MTTVNDLAPSHPDAVHALLDTLVAMSIDPDQQAVLGRVVDSAVVVTGASYGALGVLSPTDTVVEVVAAGRGPDPRGVRGHPASEQDAGRSLCVPVRNRGTVLGDLYLARRAHDEPFSASDRRAAAVLADTAGTVLERFRMFGLGERRRRWFEATASVADVFRAPLVVERALAELTMRVAAVAGARAAAVIQVPETAGSRTPVVVAAHVADGTTAYLAAALGYLRRHDVPSHDVEVGASRADRPVTVLLPLHAHVAHPTVLAVVFPDPASARDVDERDLLVAFAEQAGLALDRAQAMEDRHSLTTVAERDRVARDLHDVVMQRLFAVGMHLEGLRYGAAPDVAASLDHVVEDLDAVVKDIRSTIFRLDNSRD